MEQNKIEFSENKELKFLKIELSSDELVSIASCMRIAMDMENAGILSLSGRMKEAMLSYLEKSSDRMNEEVERSERIAYGRKNRNMPIL